MPTLLRQNINKLYTKGLSINEDTHCDLRHNHIAGVFYKGRCLSMGYNRKYCLLRGFI